MKYFDSVDAGPGIWKWSHYFDVYHKHLARFRGTNATIVEVLTPTTRHPWCAAYAYALAFAPTDRHLLWWKPAPLAQLPRPSRTHRWRRYFASRSCLRAQPGLRVA